MTAHTYTDLLRRGRIGDDITATMPEPGGPTLSLLKAALLGSIPVAEGPPAGWVEIEDYEEIGRAHV